MAQLSSQDIQDFGSFKAPGGALSQNTIDEFGSWQPAKTGKIDSLEAAINAGLTESDAGIVKLLGALHRIAGANQLRIKGLSYFGDDDTIKKYQDKAKKANEAYQKTNPGLGSDIIKDVTSMVAPSAAMMAIGAAMPAALPEIAGMTGVESAASTALKWALPNATFGAASTAPNQSIGSGTAIGAGAGIAGGAFGEIVNGLIGMISKKGIAKKYAKEALEAGVTPEHVQAAQENAGGQTLLGEVLQNPNLAKEETRINPAKGGKIGKMAVAKLKTIANGLQSQASDIFSAMTSPLDKAARSSALLSSIKEIVNKFENRMRNTFKNSDKLSKELGISFDLKPYYEEAGENAEKYTRGAEISGRNTNSSLISEMEGIANAQNKLLSKYKEGKEGAQEVIEETADLTPRGVAYGSRSAKKVIKSLKDMVYGKSGGTISAKAPDIARNKSFNFLTGKYESKIKPTLSDATFLKSDLGADKAAASLGGDRKREGVYSRLYSKVADVIKDSIEKSGSEELKDEFSKANKLYAEDIAPILENGSIRRLLSGNSDIADTISSTILPKGAVKISALKRILKYSPESGKLLLTDYLRPALNEDGSINPVKLKSLLDSLGKERIKLLAGNDKNLLDNINKFYKNMKNNKGALDFMANPPTGIANVGILHQLTKMEAVANAFKGNIAPLATMLIPSKTAKAISSEDFTELVKRAMTGENLTGKSEKNVHNIANILQQIITNMINSTQDQGNFQ